MLFCFLMIRRPPGATRTDTLFPYTTLFRSLGDKTLLPGLVDLHVHLTGDPGDDYRAAAVDPDEWGVVVGAKNAGITLRAGFTTVREAGSAQYTAYALRRGTANGFIEGPRIVAAGPALSIIGGHGDVTGFREAVHAENGRAHV